MEDASLNQGGFNYLEDIKEKETISAPDLNLRPNYFSDFQTSSEPAYTNIGFTSDQLSSSLGMAEQKAIQDPFVQAKRFETPAIPGYEAAKQSDYFEKIGVIPGMDVEETYGNAQTNWNKLSNAVFGLIPLAVNQVVDQFSSWTDTLDMFKDLSFVAPFKQAELEAINQWQNDFSNKYHIFQTQEDRNTFFNMSNFATSIQQSGYAIGAFLEIAAEEFALSTLTAATFGGASEIQALRTLQLSSKIGKVINRTRELEKSLQGVSTVRKIFNSSVGRLINPVRETTNFALDFNKLRRVDELAFGAAKGKARTAARGFGAFYRDLRMYNAGITEAKATVAPVMTEMYDSAVEDYKKNNNGQEPSDEKKKEFKDEAFKAAQSEGAVQALWIALSDRVAFDGLLKTFKGARFIDDGLVAKGIFRNTASEIEKGGAMFVAKKGVGAFMHQLKTSPVKTLLKAPILYTKENLMEGVQETGQDIIDSATKQWYLYNNGSKEQRLNQKGFNDFLYNGAKEQLTMDGLKTFMSGFLTGGILNVLGKGISGGRSLFQKAKNIDGYKASVQRADEERNKLVGSLNDLVTKKSDFYRSLVEMDSAMTNSAKDNNKKEYWDYRNDFINKYALSIIRSGTDDVILDRMKESINDLTLDEFKSAFAGTLHEGVSEEDAKNIMNGLVNTFETKLKDVKETYTAVKENYGNPYNPKKYKIGTEEYKDEVANYMAAEEAINQISFSKGTYKDIANRQVEILSSIKENLPNFSFNSLYSLTSPSLTLNKELEILQKEYDAISDPTLKTEKKQKLDLLNNYKESVKEFSEQLEEAAGDSEKIQKIKADFVEKNANTISEILKLDNKETGIGSLTTDVLNKTIGNIFDYLHLQNDFENAVSYFNLIANPVNFDNLHKAHLKQLMELLGNKETYEKAAKEFLEKNPKNNKHFILKINNNYVVFSPKGEVFREYTDKTEADSVAELLDERYDENANRITITVKDKEGKEHTIEIVENNFYLTEENETTSKLQKNELSEDEKYDLSQFQNQLNERVEGLVKNGMPKEEAEIQAYDEIFKDKKGELTDDGEFYKKLKEKESLSKKAGNKVKNKNNQKNVIKIISIEDENITYQFNYEPTLITKKAEDFGNEFGLLQNFKQLTILERFFYINRDREFDIKVNEKYGTLHKLDDKDYSDTSKMVTAVLIGEYDEDGQFVIRMKYKFKNKILTPVFNLKYYEKYSSKKQGKSKGLSVTEFYKENLLEEEKNREIQNLADQKQALVNLINRVELNVNETKKKREENTKRLEDLRAEVELMREDLQTAQEYIEKNPPKKSGRRSNEYLRMKETIDSFPEKINNIETLINDLKEELTSLTELYNTLDESRDNYYNALDEIEKTNKAFEKNSSGNIYSTEQTESEALKENLITKRFSKEEVDKFLYDTEFEIEELKEVIEKFEKFTKEAKDIWKKLSKYKDIIDILNGDDSKKWLIRYLKEEEDKSQDDDKIEFLKFLRRGIVNNNLDVQIAKELAGGFKNAKAAYDKINDELFPKLQRLQEASEQLKEVSKLDDRISFLKYVQDELFSEVSYMQERRRLETEITSAKRAELLKQNPNANIIEITNEGELFNNPDQLKRPLLRLFGLYLTTGLHYNDLEDTEINLKNGNARFFKFTDNVNLDSGDYFLMPVTKDSDQFGITYDENDVKVIIVKNENGVYKPVDITGQVIENPNADNIVYTSFRMNTELFGPLENAIEWVEKKFTTKGLTKEQISNIISGYISFIKNTKENIKQGKEIIFPILGKSKGVQVMLPKDAQTGLPQEHELEGRLLMKGHTDFSNLLHPNGQGIKLSVATDKSDGVKEGRLYMKRDDGQIFRVFNRQLNTDEKTNFIELLKYIAKLNAIEAVDPTALTKNQLQSREDILTYLQGLVFWTTEGNKSDSQNRFYINSSDGKLYKGGVGYVLSSNDIDENADALTKDLYHQVNNSLLTKTNKPFSEMVINKEGNAVVKKEYENYTEYLFKSSEPVIYTNSPEYSETEVTTPQLKSVNIIFNNPEDPFQPIVINKEKEETISIPSLNGGVNKVVLTQGQPIEFAFGNATKKESSENKTLKTNINNNVQNNQQATQPTKKLDSMFGGFGTGTQVQNPVVATNQPSPEQQLMAIQSQNLGSQVPFDTTTPEQTVSQAELDSIKNGIQPTINLTINNEPSNNGEGEGFYREKLSNTMMQTEDFAKMEAWFKLKLPNIKIVKVAELIDGKAWGAFKNGVVYIYENAEIGTGFHEAFEAVWNAYLTQFEQSDLINEFRNRTGSFTNPFTKETKNYSDASAYDVREILAEEFRTYILNEEYNITPEKETSLFGKIKNFFKDLWTTIKKYVGLTTTEKNEADKLINNVFNKINTGSYANVRFARNVSEIGTTYREAVLEDITKTIPGTTQEFTTQVIEGLTAHFFTNLHNPNLFKDSKGNSIKSNIETLLSEDSNNNKLLRQLFEKSMANVYDNIYGKNSVCYEKYFAPLVVKQRAYAGRELTQNEIDELYLQAKNEFATRNRFAIMFNNTFNNPLLAYNILKQSLQKYGLKFKEVEGIEDEEGNTSTNELEVNDNSGIRDTIFIDPKRLTATSFNILVGSLTNDAYFKTSDGKIEIRAKRNSLDLPSLVNFDSTLNLLLNELNGTYSRMVVENGDVSFYDALSAMFDKLDGKYYDKNKGYADNFVWIKRLKNRLKFAGEEGKYFTQETLNIDDIRLLIGFEKSLMNKKNTPLKTIINRNGDIYSTDALDESNEKRIREEWLNNIPRNLKFLIDKSDNNNQILGFDNEGNIVFDPNSQSYKKFQSLKVDNDRNILLSTALEYLKDLGIIFSGTIDEKGNIKSSFPPVVNANKATIIKSFKNIKNSIINTDADSINYLEDLFSNIGPESSNVKNLIAIENLMRKDDGILTSTTASGQSQYSISLPASINYILASLNESATLEEFVLSNPQLGTVDYKEGKAVIVLHPYQANSQLLKPGGLVFDEAGNKKNNIDNYLISGVSSLDTSGTDTANLTYPDRVMQEINHILNADKNGLKPIYFTIINSDKSSEFGLAFKKHFISPQIAGYGIEDDNFNDVLQIYIDHLSDEIEAALMEVDSKSNIKDYSKSVKYLGHFKDVLGFKTEEELKKENLKKSFLQKRYEQVLDGKLSKDEFLTETLISELIKKDLKDTVDSTIEALVKLGILDRGGNNPDNYIYSTNAINNTVLNDYFNTDGSSMTHNDVEKLVTYITINKELAVTEQHKLLYGHPAFYKDLAKRANGINSAKDAIVDNPSVISTMDKVIARFDGKVRSASKIQTFKNISFKDVTAVSIYYKEIAEGLYQSILNDDISKKQTETRVGAKFNEDGTLNSFILDKNGKFTGEIKTYLELNEADGQGWVMPDMYRDMLLLSSKLTNKQLQQIDYEIAYEINARSNKLKTDPAYKEYKKGKYTLKWAKEILEKGNPNAALPVIKPQYFGYAVNTAMMHPVFLKHSVQPKFYRNVEGTQYEKLYIAAQKEQIDVIGFESCQKVGALLNPKTGKFVDFHKQDGSINIEFNQKSKSWGLPDGLQIQELYTKFYGIQSEQPAIYKDKVVRGTQVTKLIMSNFKIKGEYINAKAKEKIERYNEVLKKIVTKGKEELLEELGITIDSDDNYKILDYTKMIKLLRNELIKRDLPSNLVDALNINAETKGLLYKFDTLANREKIDNILNKLVDSRVISAKMFGKPSVQVASSGYNSTNRKMMYLDNGVYTEVDDYEKLTDPQKESLIPTSSDLKFYELKDGKISKMEIYMPWFFEGIDPEDLGLKLENGVYKIPANMDQKLLNMIGFRIPTQGMNSIESIVVKGFLPRESGDMIVVPTEIVGKAGSDFDIDKLNMYIPNYVLKYSKFTKQELVDFKKSPFFDNISKSSRKIITNLSEEKFVDLIDDLNNFSVTSGMGKFGNLEEYLNANNIIGDEYNMYTELKKSLVDYNGYRRDIIKQNKAQKKEFKPIVEKIIYVESGEDTKESLQNELREIMEDLVSMPENYRQLVMPNSTATLKALATKINELKGKKDAESSMLALRKFIPSAETRERYLTGKRLVGIAALQSTSHVMCQISDIILSGKYDVGSVKFMVKYDPTIEEVDGKIKRNITINLSHNETEIGEFYLNAKTDAEGRWISENISEALSGFVDAAKDPFVFSLNINFNTAGTWFYLQKLGVPMKEIAYFFNQPAVEKYMSLENTNKSIFKTVNNDSVFREQMFIESISEYFGMLSDENATLITNINILLAQLNEKDLDKQGTMDINVALKAEKIKLYAEILKIRENNKKPSLQELEDAIKNLNNPKYKFTKKDAELQIAMLSDYLEYKDQSSNLTEFISNIGYDNKKTKTLIENKLQQIGWDRMVTSGFISNPESILNTFIGEMKKQKEDLFPLFKDMFISLDDKALPVFEKLYDFLEDRDIFISNEDKSLLINKYQNFFIAYIIQNTPFKYGQTETRISDMFEILMRGSDSLANQLLALKQSSDYNISQNLAVKELLPIFANNSDGVDNIKLFRNKMDTYKNDVLIESINNLLDYAKASGNIELESFINNLSIFTILQSGLQNSTINYTKILPAHLYSRFINELLTVYKASDESFDADLIWRQFHQNSKFDRNLNKKPKFVKKLENSASIYLNADYSDSNYEFIIQSAPKIGITDDDLKNLGKFKKAYKGFDYWIYQRNGYEIIKEQEYAKYDPIIPLGDGRNYTETSIYNLVTQSKIKKNNVLTDDGWKRRSTFESENKSTPVISTTPVTATELKIAFEQLKDQIGRLPMFQNQSQAAVATNMIQLSQAGGENISYSGSEFAKKLTNPGNNLVFKFRNVQFRNAEHAYQTWKSGEFDENAFKSNEFKPKGSKKVNIKINYKLMVDIITEKLKQYPELIKGINDRGGLKYINASTHDVKGTDKFWETKSGKNKFIEALAEAYTNVQPKSIKGYGFDSVSITKEKYTRELVRKNPDIAYIYTENNYSLTAFPDKEGKNTAVIRPELNAYAIVTKKKYDYDTRENVDYSNSESDFEEFKSVNTELIQKIKQSGKSKVVFPDGFGTGLAKMPTRFAEWLQQELYNNFGLVTELDKTKTGLISKGVTTQGEAEQERKLMDGKSYPISQINSELLENIGYTPLQINNILKTIC